MIIGVAYFAGWHPSDWAVIHFWLHMLNSHVIWGISILTIMISWESVVATRTYTYIYSHAKNNWKRV